MPKVSVIVPVYGVEKYIERCARSLFEQTLEDIEFIFVDDCTPDKSIEILKNVLEDYPQRKKQVKIERHEKNRGLPIARQSGLKVASGDYIIHCDSDDWVDVTMYEKMFNKALEEDADMVVCDYYRTDGVTHRDILGFISMQKEPFIREMLYMRTSWAVWNKLAKRDLYHPNFTYPTGAMAEDLLISTQLALLSKRISFLRDPFYYYYDNPTSIVNTTSYEAGMRKFKQATDNAALLASIILNTPEYVKYREPLYYAMSLQKNLLLPYFRIAKAKDIFYRTFKGVEAKVIFNPEVSLKDRFRSILIASHLYTLIKSKYDGINSLYDKMAD